VVDVSYGFAEIEFANRMFQDPCEENDIIGYREAIGLKFTVVGSVDGGASSLRAKIRFTVNYLRPGETVKTSWTAIFELFNGTYERYIYHTDLKYKKGQYTGLTLGIDFLK
jgi:hypothetical protein